MVCANTIGNKLNSIQANKTLPNLGFLLLISGIKIRSPSYLLNLILLIILSNNHLKSNAVKYDFET